MNNALFISIVILGISIILLNIFHCIKHNKPFDQTALVNTILLTTGFLSGLCLMAGTVIEDFNKLLEDSKLYVFISGLTILAVSIHQLHKDILKDALPTKFGSYIFFGLVSVIFLIAMGIYLDIKI
jgi:magnesium-transporting ATPase (P-type)